MSAALSEVYGNASSTHRAGQVARQHLEKSRKTISEFIRASPPEFVFTSGGTESNNLAILGLVRNLAGGRKHVITTSIEHPSVLESCRQLELEGVEITYLDVDIRGLVDPEDVRSRFRSETALVSVMHANNEVGTIQPVREIAEMVRGRRDRGQQVFLHSDGVQALGKIDVNVRELGVDLYSVSAHKLFAPKGIGGLFVRKGTPLRAIQYGGRHERERRAGTENVPGAMAFACAVELCDVDAKNSVRCLRDQFEFELLSNLDNVEINGSKDSRLPNTSNLLFHGISAEALVIALDMRGIAVSTGSACSSGSVEPSHVLLAMGRTREEAKASVRFSFGRYNSSADVDLLADAVLASIGRLRNSARLENPVAV